MNQPKLIHFHGLNGIRAICALAVVISHASASLSLLDPSLSGGVFSLAGYGVTAFFALSGFLITYLLVEEKEYSGSVSIKKFYVRRVLRIWPLYFGYMLIAVIADAAIFHFYNFSSLGYYVFFLPNIPTSFELARLHTLIPIYLLGHFWSLGIEEQFYAFYPWLVKKFKNLFTLLGVMLGVILLIKLVAKYVSYRTENAFWYAWADNTRFDAMAIGGFGAWFLKYHAGKAAVMARNKPIQFLVAIIVGLVLFNRLNIPTTILHMLFAVVTVLCIFYAHLFANPLVNLRSAPMDFLGKISFGIYVYHPIIIGFSLIFVKLFDLSVFAKAGLYFSLVLTFTILLAALSYNHLEKYFLKLKTIFAVVKSIDAEKLDLIPEPVTIKP